MVFQPGQSGNPDRKFPPGVSGNPGGRPKGTSLTAMIREFLDRDEIDGKKLPDGKRVKDFLIEGIIRPALKGDIRHQQEILNRVDGKVPDRVQVEEVRKAYDVENSPDDL